LSSISRAPKDPPSSSGSRLFAALAPVESSDARHSNEHRADSDTDVEESNSTAMKATRKSWHRTAVPWVRRSVRPMKPSEDSAAKTIAMLPAVTTVLTSPNNRLSQRSSSRGWSGTSQALLIRKMKAALAIGRQVRGDLDGVPLGLGDLLAVPGGHGERPRVGLACVRPRGMDPDPRRGGLVRRHPRAVRGPARTALRPRRRRVSPPSGGGCPDGCPRPAWCERRSCSAP
jgi:hypothetical protein